MQSKFTKKYQALVEITQYVSVYTCPRLALAPVFAV